jgi:hypothetical protein
MRTADQVKTCIRNLNGVTVFSKPLVIKPSTLPEVTGVKTTHAPNSVGCVYWDFVGCRHFRFDSAETSPHPILAPCQVTMETNLNFQPAPTFQSKFPVKQTLEFFNVNAGITHEHLDLAFTKVDMPIPEHIDISNVHGRFSLTCTLSCSSFSTLH